MQIRATPSIQSVQTQIPDPVTVFVTGVGVVLGVVSHSVMKSIQCLVEDYLIEGKNFQNIQGLHRGLLNPGL